MKLPIYLDYAATTPVDPRVVAKMQKCLAEDYGNSASLHPYGAKAQSEIEEARAHVAAMINAEPDEIIWTSGTTESVNLALKGAAQLYQQRGKHIVTLKTEHKAVLDTCQHLEKEGYSVTYLTPEADGLLDKEKFLAALRPDTILVAICHINNELGVEQNIAELANITAQREILLLVDGAQSVGKVSIDVKRTPIDLLAFSAHKIYGPKGIGALYMRRKPRVRVAPQMHGGGHQQGMRSGTLPTHQIVSMGEALRIAKQEMAADYKKVSLLRKIFWEKISTLKSVTVNGADGYPGILNVCFPGMRAEKFMQALPELAVATGSACNAKSLEPSYVLRALGLTAEQAHCAIRFSFGRFTTEEEINYAANAVCGLF